MYELLLIFHLSS